MAEAKKVVWDNPAGRLVENVRNNISRGWQRLTDRVAIFGEETRTEWGIVKDVSKAVAEQWKEHVSEPASEAWKDAGKNFGERLVATAKGAGELIRDGFVALKENVGKGIHDLQQRYKKEGISATIGIVADAVHGVGGLVQDIAESAMYTAVSANAAMALVQTEKMGRTAEVMEKLNRGKDENKFVALGQTLEHVNKRRNMFIRLMDSMNERYQRLATGRGELSDAKFKRINDLDEQVEKVKNI